MYFASPELQQSMLKKLSNGTLTDFIFHKDNKVDLSHKEGIMIGSAVDTWLTNSEEAYKDEYYESTTVKPGDKMASIIERVFNLIEQEHKSIDGDITPDTIKLVKEAKLQDYTAYIELAIDENEYQIKWKQETRINKVIEQYPYFQSLQSAYGKKVLSPEDANLIRTISLSIINNPRTKKYFDRNYQASISNMEFHYQVPIYFRYRGIDCKALLDLIIVCKDDNGKVLWVQGVDLKTTRFETLGFLQAVKTQGYHIQAAWYTIALQSWIQEKGFIVLPDSNKKESGHFPEIKNFTFVVESTLKSEAGKKPLVFKCSDDLLEIGLKGRDPIEIDVTPYPTNQNNLYLQLFENKEGDFTPLKIKSSIISRRIFGIEQLISIYLYHVQNGFGEEKVLLEAGLKPITLDWDDDFRELYFR